MTIATLSVHFAPIGNYATPVPIYRTAGAAGMDLAAALDPCEIVVLGPCERAVIKTGWCVAIPEGYEGQVRSRSGCAAKLGLVVLNSPGTIDSDYRGEIGVIMINHSDAPVEIRPGDRIAQLVICPVAKGRSVVVSVDDLGTTVRGTGGYGSTGHAAISVASTFTPASTKVVLDEFEQRVIDANREQHR